MMPFVGRLGKALGQVCLAASIFGRPSFAEEEEPRASARLEWTRSPGAESCIDRAGLSDAVSRRWGRQVFVDGDDPAIVVKGTVGRSRRGTWYARIELARSDGTKLGSRVIVTHAPDCSSLDDSLALALGLMLDLTEPPASTEPNRPPSAPPQVSGPPITIPKETLAPRVPWQIEPALGAEAALGILPGVMFGGRLSISIEPPRLWRIEIGGTLWQHVKTSATEGARFSLWTIDVAVCPAVWEDAKIAASACIAQRAGKVTAEGVGFDANATPDETFLAAELRGGLAWTFASPFVLGGTLGMDVPLVRFRFVYREPGGAVGAVYRMSPVAGIVALGIGARF